MTFDPRSLLRPFLGAAALAFTAIIALPAAAQTAGDKDKGFELAEKLCNSCHLTRSTRAGEDVEGGQRPGPMFQTLNTIEEQRFRDFLTRPHPRPARLMPDFEKLTPQDMANLLAYIRTVR